jgi:two-component system chemotaxis response regulator CheB
VLVVDDSILSRLLLTRVLTADRRIEVVGCAHSGAEAVAVLAHASPDVVTMDIHMPGQDGFAVTRQIMETRPVPIVVVSSDIAAGEMTNLFRAMEAGAVAVVEKPSGPGHPMHVALSRQLVETVLAMAQVRVVRRWSRARGPRPEAEPPAVPAPADAIRLIAIGASTGGPPALLALLGALPRPCPVPVLVVQHISAGFIEGLARWLELSSGLRVKVAEHQERLVSGEVYLAPDDRQMELTPDWRLACEPGVAQGLCPSVAALFRSLARVCGATASAVLLTGMGRDGAAELKLMRERGAVTFAQDQASSVVFGMPGAAVEIGAATHVAAPAEIGAMLSTLLMNRQRL